MTELFTANAPHRLCKRRAVYGDSDFRSINEAKQLFPETGSDAFFGANSQQLIAALIADEILESKIPNLASVREKMSKTLGDLMKHLKAIVEKFEIGAEHQGDFIHQLAAPLSDMDLRSFTSIHASASKDANWLTIHIYSSLVCGNSFRHARAFCIRFNSQNSI